MIFSFRIGFTVSHSNRERLLRSALIFVPTSWFSCRPCWVFVLTSYGFRAHLAVVFVPTSLRFSCRPRWDFRANLTGCSCRPRWLCLSICPLGWAHGIFVPTSLDFPTSLGFRADLMGFSLRRHCVFLPTSLVFLSTTWDFVVRTSRNLCTHVRTYLKI